MKCLTHPAVDTNLRCGKCGKPICPKCLVSTPVGARCLECARLYRLPTYQVSPVYYMRGVGAGVGLAALGGVLWGLIQMWVPFFYLNFLLALAVGYGIGELVSLSVNRKRGIGLALIAGISVVLSYVVSLVLRGGFPLVPFHIQFLLSDLLALALGIFAAARSFVGR